MKTKLDNLTSKLFSKTYSRRDNGDEALEQKVLYLPFLGLRFHLRWVVATSSWNGGNAKNNWFEGVRFQVKLPNGETIVFNMYTGDKSKALQEAPWQDIFEEEMDYLEIH